MSKTISDRLIPPETKTIDTKVAKIGPGNADMWGILGLVVTKSTNVMIVLRLILHSKLLCYQTDR